MTLVLEGPGPELGQNLDPCPCITVVSSLAGRPQRKRRIAERIEHTPILRSRTGVTPRRGTLAVHGFRGAILRRRRVCKLWAPAREKTNWLIRKRKERKRRRGKGENGSNNYKVDI